MSGKDVAVMAAVFFFLGLAVGWFTHERYIVKQLGALLSHSEQVGKAAAGKH
jgi:hypothetical protein